MTDDQTSLEARLLTLLHKAREDHDETARQELNALLRANGEARSLLPLLLVDEQALVSQLREERIQALIAPHSIARGESGGRDGARFPRWRSIASAAAGLTFGVFCTSVVFARVMPALEKSLSLLDADFEDVSAPQPSGVPRRFGEWSGDFAEIVSGQDGVAPHSGSKMWRFLRADNAENVEVQASYVGEAVHAIDLKPLRHAGLKAASQIEISAWFAAGQRAPDYRYHWNIKAAAFEGSVRDAPELWRKWDQASTSLVQREVPTAEPGHWQRVSVTMVLPTNADYLVFECAVVQKRPALTEGVAQFPAHYLDDVRVRILPPTREAQTQK